MYRVGSRYNRRIHIHQRYGGQEQGGISTPARHPYIFLFTGESGHNYGYRDEWVDGVFRYVGEGQVGDMEMIKGNRAIRDHLENGKELFLFRQHGGGMYEFLGDFVCSSWETANGHDRERNPRGIIVFHLVPSDQNIDVEIEAVDETQPEVSLEQLRLNALEASQRPPQIQTSQALSQYIRRSEAVKRYVLARAGGFCQACEKEAPFRKRNGEPYLEPHHTLRISDSGPDHPRWVAAVCPNCHREVHSGVDGERINEELKEKLGRL